jgi:hypothetical protein
MLTKHRKARWFPERFRHSPHIGVYLGENAMSKLFTGMYGLVSLPFACLFGQVGGTGWTGKHESSR